MDPVITRSMTAPARSEVAALLAELRALGVDPPADAVRALELVDEVERLAAPPDVAGWVAQADLSTLGAEDVMTGVHRSVVQLRLTDPAGRGLLREAVDALTTRAVTALAGDVDRIIDHLRPAWDAAAAVVHAAAAAGIRTGSTTTDAVQLGDSAVEAWRRVGPAVAELDRLHRVAVQLWCLAGRDVDGEASPRWLDLAATGPLQLGGTPAPAVHHPEEINV